MEAGFRSPHPCDVSICQLFGTKSRQDKAEVVVGLIRNDTYDWCNLGEMSSSVMYFLCNIKSTRRGEGGGGSTLGAGVVCWVQSLLLSARTFLPHLGPADTQGSTLTLTSSIMVPLHLSASRYPASCKKCRDTDASLRCGMYDSFRASHLEYLKASFFKGNDPPLYGKGGDSSAMLLVVVTIATASD